MLAEVYCPWLRELVGIGGHAVDGGKWVSGPIIPIISMASPLHS